MTEKIVMIQGKIKTVIRMKEVKMEMKPIEIMNDFIILIQLLKKKV